jgi:hypothetical protein
MEHQPSPDLRQSYNFAMSSFARMYGVRSIQSNNAVHAFCVKWAKSKAKAPNGKLTTVDFYFRDLFINMIGNTGDLL